jgi:FkbM family methyltransferase
VAINELKNVSVFDLALGERDGDISFNIYPKGFCNPGMSSKYMETPITRKITVAQKTIDTFVREQGIEKVDFIKMDIQGAEMDVLMGSADTIRKYKPTIFLEAYEGYNDTQALYSKLKEHGYKIYLIGEQDIIPIENAAGVKDGNWLARN